MCHHESTLPHSILSMKFINYSLDKYSVYDVDYDSIIKHIDLVVLNRIWSNFEMFFSTIVWTTKASIEH